MMEKTWDHLSVGSSKKPLMNIPKAVGGGAWGILPGSDAYHGSNDATLFSSSLPVLPHEKLIMNGMKNDFQSIDDALSNLNKIHQDVEDDNDSFGALGVHAIGCMLPDDEEDLLAGIMDDFDLSGLPCHLDDLEDGDIFGSGGGMELESDILGLSKMTLTDGVMGNGMTHLVIPNGLGAAAGEHPYGEHPSRTLFVRNINSNVEDSELKTLFEQYGDIRTLYTVCKHRGFVMISYYDIRAARTAMRSLQNKPLRRRKLDIHFSIPKDNPSDKDVNQGTLVVFNLDPSVSSDDLLLIFGDYGEVKEIRETPHKRHHKFIEFYDVRAAEAALKALNKSDIAGKRVKLEPSRPGGARRSLMLQQNQELEFDETQTFVTQVGSPLSDSPPGNWVQFSNPNVHNPLHTFSNSPGSGLNTINNLPGLASVLHPKLSNHVQVAPISKAPARSSYVENMFTNTNLNQSQTFSLPEPKLNGSAMDTLSGPEFLWGSSSPYSEQIKSTSWTRPYMGHPFTSNGQGFNGMLHSSHHETYLNSNPNHHNHHHLHHHHIGSAPSGVPVKRHFGFFQESPETSFMNSAFAGIGIGPNFGNMAESVSPNFGMMSSSPRLTRPIFPGNGPYPGLAPTYMENFSDRGRIRRYENNGNQMDSKKQFQLNLDKIVNGEDIRTTLMIKNIPNKYTSKMLLAAIDESNRSTYDFLYLPIDFKNKCNVGYAFINMLSAKHIIQFFKAINGKKWEKFNSEKVASLAYARIQGKAALVTHFQNSSLMNEDKRCRPILFLSDGAEDGDQIIEEHLRSCSMNNILVRQSNGSQSRDFLGSPTELEDIIF